MNKQGWTLHKERSICAEAMEVKRYREGENGGVERQNGKVELFAE